MITKPAHRLTGVVVALLLAALGLWSSTRLVWVYASYHSPLRGPLVLSATGAQCRPELSGLALLALAGIAGLVAVRGWGRRMVALPIGLAGVWSVWLASNWYFGGAPGSRSAVEVELPTGAVPDGLPTRTLAPLLVLVAGLMLILAATSMVRWSRRMPGLGSRYAAPAARRESQRGDDWWRALDTGEDPTLLRRATDDRLAGSSVNADDPLAGSSINTDPGPPG